MGQLFLKWAQGTFRGETQRFTGFLEKKRIISVASNKTRIKYNDNSLSIQ